MAHRIAAWLGALALSGAAGAAGAGCITECTPRVGIMAAFGQEADLLLARLEQAADHRINGTRYSVGVLEGTPVVLVTSGIGLPNAIMVAQILVDHFAIDSLVMTGIAGGLSASHEVGDVLVPRHWAFHQEGYHANGAGLPAPCGTPGELACLGLQLAADLPPYQDYFPRNTNVVDALTGDRVALRDPYSGAPVAYGSMVFDYAVDARMAAAARRASEAVAPALEAFCPGGGACIQPRIALEERCVSGSGFLANSAVRLYLANELGASCVDMETAGVAHAARANGVPFIAFRSLSDLAGDDRHPEKVGAFFSSGVAQRNAARVTLGFLREWASERVDLAAR